jgi:hypothetical protein
LNLVARTRGAVGRPGVHAATLPEDNKVTLVRNQPVFGHTSHPISSCDALMLAWSGPHTMVIGRPAGRAVPAWRSCPLLRNAASPASIGVGRAALFETGRGRCGLGLGQQCP